MEIADVHCNTKCPILELSQNVLIKVILSLIGQSRKEKLMEFCDKFAQEIEIALPRMSKKYKDFYQYFLEDKKVNGSKII